MQVSFIIFICSSEAQKHSYMYEVRVLHSLNCSSSHWSVVQKQSVQMKIGHNEYFRNLFNPYPTRPGYLMP